MPKRRIAIVHGGMVIGGAERVLINLLHVIDYSIYDVDLFLWKRLTKDEPSFENKIDEHVNVYFISELRYNRYNPYYSNRLYDCAIAFQGIDLDLLETVNHHLRAKIKVAWIHGNCSVYNYSEQLKSCFIKEYSHIDKIYCVSHKVEIIFQRFYPTLQGKTEVFYNIINTEEILLCAKEETGICKDEFSILSVGRITPEKGHILIPSIAKRLKDDGYSFKWYIVGDGISRLDVEKEIRILKVQDVVEIIGYQSNPYPYIKACDLFVLPSFNEGYGMVAAEALVLNRPIVITKECGIAEQIKNGVTGLVSAGITEQSIYECVRKVFSNSGLLEFIKNSIAFECFDNSSEILKLYGFIEHQCSKKTYFDLFGLLKDLFHYNKNKIMPNL